MLWWAQLNEVEDVYDVELPLATSITACTLIVPPAFCLANRRVDEDGKVKILGKDIKLATLFPNASKFFDAQFDGERGSRFPTYL